MQCTRAPTLLRFSSFEVNLSTGELRHEGLRVKLPAQSFHILAMLLERPGELILREAIQKQLWPNDTVVEFESSINAAVRRLRLALGDSAETPRFIETLARRGYRFIGQIQVDDSSQTGPAAESPQSENVQGESLTEELADSAFSPGRKVAGRYRIEAFIGRGAFGKVYRAHDEVLNRPVALKTFELNQEDSPGRVETVLAEARTIAKLDHDNIVSVFDAGHEGNAAWIVMRLVKGEGLNRVLEREGRFERHRAARLLRQISMALDHAHHKGIIHRDVKPSNILVEKREDGSEHAWLADFGIAQMLAGAPLKERLVAGTPSYMSPEQIAGKQVDARTDIFAVGCVAYELITGQRAFPSETRTDGMRRVIHDQPELMSQLSSLAGRKFESVCGRALAEFPEDRYQTAEELLIELESVERDGGDGPAPVASGLLAKMARPQEPARGGTIIAAIALTLVVIGVGLYKFVAWKESAAAIEAMKLAMTAKDTIVLSDFDNKTDDTVFDDTLKQGLSVQLEQSPFLTLLSERRVNETLKLMGRPAGDRLTPEVTHEVCQRTSSKAMLTGSIAGLGSQYVIGLKAVNCNTGDVLAEAQEQAAGKEAVLKALDAAAVSLRGKLGESLSSVQKYATPVEEATTPSLEALKTYSLGIRTAYAKGSTAALPFFNRAVGLDPNFAMAYVWMAEDYANLNEVGRAGVNARKAYELREKVSDRERLHIEGNYYLYTTGDLERAAQVFEMRQQIYSRDSLPYVELGLISGYQGNWEKAMQEFQAALGLEPSNGITYLDLGITLTTLNRLDEAEAVYKQAEGRRLENELMLQSRYWLAFLRGDAALMAQLVSAAMGKPGTEDLLLATQADTEGWYGKLKNAHELTRRAMDSAQHNDAMESAAAYQVAAALRDVESGDREQVRAEANAALKVAPNRDVRAVAALALARAGDTAGAEKLAVELDKTFPLDTLVQRYWLPTIRAGVALERKDPNRATEVLKPASTIELSEPTNLTIFLCPVYLRGEAYLMLHDGNRAALEFQKFIDHRGLVMNFPWGALARLGLARAYALQDDTAKARTAYQDFLTLWKDADPDIPILRQAKAEYAKLK